MNTNGTSSLKVSYELTPNPATMKFNFSEKVADAGFYCPNGQAADKSPRATNIFGFPWASSVYIGTDFITVTKQDWVDWEILAQPLANIIQEHVERGEPIVVEIIQHSEADDINDSDIVRNIKSTLNREIRPVVALDGGDIVFSKYEDNILYIHMKGACAGCPSSQVTLKEGVEVRLKELFPEIKEVVSI